MDNKERFLALLRTVKRPGVDDLIQWLEGSDFFTAPASTRFHGSYPGGLLQHSLNVYDELERLLAGYHPDIQVDADSAILCALLHDLCKVNFYATEYRNRKNEEGKWERYEAYTVQEKFRYGGHGAKSVFLAQHFIDLTPEEAVAIHCHMGGFSDDPKSVCGAFEQFPFAWLLSVADQSATYMLEPRQSAQHP